MPKDKTVSGKRNIFKDIMSGLDEALGWAKGKGKAKVTLPGQKPKMMTKAEYNKAKLKE